MATIPKSVLKRFVQGIKRFQPVLESARKRDVNESDTSRIVADILSQVFGYDSYSEITTEYAIRGTYCDLAIKLNDTLSLLIEVKAIGSELNQKHIKQAVDYGVNSGLEWVVLTNGYIWMVYHIIYGKPIQNEEILEINLMDLNHRKTNTLEPLYPLSIEGFKKNALDEHKNQRQALSRYVLGALIQTDPIMKVLRREVKRMSPDVKIELDDLRSVITSEVLRRDIIEGEEVGSVNSFL